MNYDDNNPKHRRAVDEWLTRPRKNLNRVVYDPSIDEKKTHHNIDLKKIADDRLGKDPGERILKATSYYDENPSADEALRKLLIEKMNKGQNLDSDEVRFMMETKPKQKEATPQQMAELKKKLDKYKYIHGETKPANMGDFYMNKQKPFKKKSAVLSIPRAEEPKVAEPKLEVKPREPEKPLEQIIAERSAERLKREQENFDQQFGTQGIVKLLRPL